jgi:hypothetical protein
MHVRTQTLAERERTLTHWRKMAAIVEQGDLPYQQLARFEDYLTIIAALVGHLAGYTTFDTLVVSWEQQALRAVCRQACVLGPGRGALNPEIVEGAIYWRRFCQLIRACPPDHR